MADSSHVNVNSEVVLVLSTFSDLATAETCAKHLVEHSNAACVQIDGPIRSVYQWKGDIQTDEEFRLLVKTSPESLDECVTALKQHHPYELPEIVVLHAHASAAYASWVTEQTSGRK
jgi:periplasmic divalent cation tolerance protein